MHGPGLTPMIENHNLFYNLLLFLFHICVKFFVRDFG